MMFFKNYRTHQKSLKKKQMFNKEILLVIINLKKKLKILFNKNLIQKLKKQI